MNTSDEVIKSIVRLLLRQLNFVEQLVLSQSWLGRTYTEMAQSSGYSSEYIREVGSQLWQELSEVLGQRVTKKNLRTALEQYQLEHRDGNRNKKQQEPQRDTQAVGSLRIAQELELRFPSGPLRVGSPQYVNRPPIEELACAEISRSGCMLCIKAPVKMGKSSLLNQLFAHAARHRYKTIYVDFREADAAVFACLNKFLRWFCANITRQLHLVLRLDDYWDEDMGSKLSCKIYLEGYLLEQINSPLVLALNEVDRVFEYPAIAQDFLPLLRSWHEAAQQVDVWQKLRLVIVYSTEIYVPLKLNQSPFNSGLTLKLPSFNLEQVQELAHRYGLDWQGEAGTRYALSLLAMVGGHPYLVSLALYYLHLGEMTLEELLQTAPTTGGIYSHHLRSHLAVLQEQPQLASALRQIVTTIDGGQLDAMTAYKLESMGLIQLDGSRAKLRCKLYQLYFHSHLRTEQWLDSCSTQLPPGQLELQHTSNINKLSRPPDRSYFNQYLSSKIDRLTHFANRSYFNQYLETTWQQLLQEEAASLSLILSEIHQFPVFKNTHGLTAGDICLQLISSKIMECVGKRIACVARYENQKFAVILPQTNADFATAIADNIRESVRALAIELHNSEDSRFPTQELVVTVGVASTIPNSATPATILVAAAEDALHQAKEGGYDGVTTSSTIIRMVLQK